MADPIPVITRSEDGEAEIGRAISWVVERRKLFAWMVTFAVGGCGSLWVGVEHVMQFAEERVLRRQAESAQAKSVERNGADVRGLTARVVRLEGVMMESVELLRGLARDNGVDSVSSGN